MFSAQTVSHLIAAVLKEKVSSEKISQSTNQVCCFYCTPFPHYITFGSCFSMILWMMSHEYAFEFGPGKSIFLQGKLVALLAALSPLGKCGGINTMINNKNKECLIVVKYKFGSMHASKGEGMPRNFSGCSSCHCCSLWKTCTRCFSVLWPFRQLKLTIYFYKTLTYPSLACFFNFFVWVLHNFLFPFQF